MLKFIKKLLPRKKKKVNVDALSSYDHNDQMSFLSSLLELVEKSEEHPINIFLTLLQYFTILSGDIYLKENPPEEFNDTELFLNSVIKETHQFLSQQVEKLKKSASPKSSFYVHSSNYTKH